MWQPYLTPLCIHYSIIYVLGTSAVFSCMSVYISLMGHFFWNAFTVDHSKAVFLLQFLFGLFSVECCSVISFRVILTLFDILGRLCSVIMDFLGIPISYT